MTTTDPQPAGAAAPVEARRLGYQPALDGVRGIAVALVVLYHYPWGPRPSGNPMHGGFLGVDVFFVLSGFLITTLLLQERATHGGVNLRNFYARRALRLLPAFGVLWAIAFVLHFTLSAGDPLRVQWRGLLSSLFYVGNWVSIPNPSAFGMLAHTWSLAVEEQFYFVWPAILVFCLRRGLRLRTVGVLTAAAAAASAAFRAALWQHEIGHANFAYFYFRITSRPPPIYKYPGSGGRPFTFEMLNHLKSVWNRIYFGSDTQADALLAGCVTAIVLFAFLPRLSARGRARLAGAACVAVVVTAAIVSQAYSRFSSWLPEWGFLAFAVSIAFLITGLVVAPRAPLARAFAFAPLVWVGRRSYAIYLFHELVMSQLQRSKVDLPAPLSFAFQMIAITVAAELSFRLVEAPMLRRKHRFEPAPALRQ